MAGEPITREEMIAMFGESMPMEAVQLAWNADGTKTVGEIRDELRALGKRTKARRDDMDIVERLRNWLNMPQQEQHETSIEAADEIEMLRRVEHEAAEWVEERTKRLRADNERLRAALREIADAYGEPEDDENAGWMRDTARRALGRK